MWYVIFFIFLIHINCHVDINKFMLNFQFLIISFGGYTNDSVNSQLWVFSILRSPNSQCLMCCYSKQRNNRFSFYYRYVEWNFLFEFHAARTRGPSRWVSVGTTEKYPLITRWHPISQFCSGLNILSRSMHGYDLNG